MTRSLVFILLTWALAAATAPNVAYVLERQGDWSVDGVAKPLGVGAAIAAGAKIVNGHPKDGDTLVLIDPNGDLLKRVRCARNECHECRTPDTCTDAVQPVPAAKTSVPSTPFSAAMDLLASKPDRYTVPRISGPALADAVVVLDQDHCDLSPVLYQLTKGAYSLRWRDLNFAKAKPLTTSVDLTPGRPALVAAAPAAGLYELTLVEKTAPKEGSPTAWILLVPTGQSLGATASFQQALSRAAKWSPNVSPEAARSFLRASLDDIARHTRQPDAPAKGVLK